MKFIKMLCPWHVEETPSFSYNKKNGEFFCFGCSAKGNIFKDNDKISAEVLDYIYCHIHPEWHCCGNPYEIVQECKDSNPWLCHECFIPALIDRGDKIQCQSCGCENERMEYGENDCLAWKKQKEKILGKLLRPFDSTHHENS